MSEAFYILKDPAKRDIYDRLGEAGLKAAGGDTSSFQHRNVDANDLFRQFFKGFSGFGFDFGDDPFDRFNHLNSNYSSRRRYFKLAPKVVEIELYCSLEELYFGKKRRMKVSRESLTVARSKEKILEVNVQPGWQRNTKITFRNEGNEIRPGTFQHICFIIKEKKHDHFIREWHNLIMTRTINLSEALTGTVYILCELFRRIKVCHEILLFT